MAGRTRAKMEHLLFGQPSDLPSAQLSTVGDALKLILLYKSEDEAGNISTIWIQAVADRTKVPIVHQKLVEDRLRKIYDKGIGILKNRRQKKIPGFKEKMENLFDICFSICPDISCQTAK